MRAAPPRPRALRPGDTVSLGPRGLPMRVLDVLPDRVVVRWLCGGKEYTGAFESWRLQRRF